jgi:hypothetical protein
MMPFNPLVGEVRVHYAGLWTLDSATAGGGSAARVVLEVQPQVPFVLEDGQIIGRPSTKG